VVGEGLSFLNRPRSRFVLNRFTAVWINLCKGFNMLANYVRTALAVKLNELKVDKRAVTAIEYALIAALIAVVIIGAVSSLGTHISSTFNTVAA
jgi:pilus assembly protein Flp/PilA